MFFFYGLYPFAAFSFINNDFLLVSLLFQCGVAFFVVLRSKHSLWCGVTLKQQAMQQRPQMTQKNPQICLKATK